MQSPDLAARTCAARFARRKEQILFQPVLARLEPFALDLWRDDLAKWMPRSWDRAGAVRGSYFGGLYQMITIER